MYGVFCWKKNIMRILLAKCTQHAWYFKMIMYVCAIFFPSWLLCTCCRNCMQQPAQLRQSLHATASATRAAVACNSLMQQPAHPGQPLHATASATKAVVACNSLCLLVTNLPCVQVCICVRILVHAYIFMIVYMSMCMGANMYVII